MWSFQTDPEVQAQLDWMLDFVKRTSILKLGAEQLAALGPAAVTLARADGLEAHGRSVSIRSNREPDR